MTTSGSVFATKAVNAQDKGSVLATKAAEAQLKHSRTKAVNIRERQCNGIATAVNSSALSHGKRLTPSQIPAGTASSALHKGRHVFELCRQVFEPRGGEPA